MLENIRRSGVDVALIPIRIRVISISRVTTEESRGLDMGFGLYPR